MINAIYVFDFGILNLIQSIRTPILDKIMTYITYLGSGGIFWIAFGILLLFIKKTRINGIKMLTALLISFLIGVILIKHLLLRERPFTFDEAIINMNNMIILPPSDRYSFPSGHTITSFSAAWIAYGISKKTGIAATALSVLIAFSRMYLYVHFPTDIIGAVVLSVPCAIISEKLINLIISKTKGSF